MKYVSSLLAELCLAMLCVLFLLLCFMLFGKEQSYRPEAKRG